MNWSQASDLLGQSFGVGKGYQVDAVPRFIFIDKEGKIISAAAPNASDKALQDLIEEYVTK